MSEAQMLDAVLERCIAILCRQAGYDTLTRGALEMLKQLTAACRLWIGGDRVTMILIRF
jgi:hypothetical protein